LNPEPEASLKGKSFLVTGGAGFIGSHIVERLLNGGAKVVAVDDLSNGKLANLPVGNSRWNTSNATSGTSHSSRWERSTASSTRPLARWSPLSSTP
jgi:NAD(P)-dependent dehydrogenase (short-subunit alcohol dehydrogenase family)